MTDADFLLHVLEDGHWHSLDEILARSTDERGHGFTVHSRASTLRGRGYVVENEVRRNSRRAQSFYRLRASDEVPAGTVPLAVPSPLLPGLPPGPDGTSSDALRSQVRRSGEMARGEDALLQSAVDSDSGVSQQAPRDFLQRSLFEQPFVCRVDESAGLAS